MSDDRIDAVVGAFLQRLERGEPADPEDVLRAHPDLADALRERLGVLLRLDATFGPRAVPDAAGPSLVGRRLGPFRLAALLGAGGMGTVYLGETDEASDESSQPSRVAVKVVHPRFLARPGSPERFLREAELGRRVSHPNVVRTLGAGEDRCGGATWRYLVLELVEGRTLRRLADDEGRLPEQLCRHLGREVARALSAMHAAGVVHRDLKPENVLVTPEHVVKVMDLGVARAVGDSLRLSETGAFVGSVLYGAPEQFHRAGEVDARADLHALGVLLHELVTGEHPFAGDDLRVVIRRIVEERPRRLGAVDPQVSPFLEELVAQLLEKEPSRRPASADEVARALEEGEESSWWRERSAALRRATSRPLRRARVPCETALYGREAELRRLRDLYARAREGAGAVVLLEGEAGIGKSRLVDALARALEEDGEEFDLLVGSHPPAGAATAGGALAEAFRLHLGAEDADVRDVLPETPLLVPAFAALLRGEPTPDGAEPLASDSLSAVFVHATRMLARRRTTVLVVEDLHFAPEQARRVFASIAHAVTGHRVLLVGTARPETDSGWLAQLEAIGAERVRLDRLDASDVVALLDEALRSRHVAEDLASRVLLKSDGNPYFVFEILRSLRDRRLLARSADGRWTTTGTIREIRVPRSVRELIDARLAELSADERHALDAAACIGHEFDASVVADVLGVAVIQLLQRLAAVERRSRLVRAAGHVYVFDHHQVQERLAESLAPALRAAYHARIAEVLEARHAALAPADGRVAVDLATHFLAGGQGERARCHLSPALEFLARSGRPDAAVELAQRALDAAGVLAGRERAEVLAGQLEHLEVLGRTADQKAPLAELGELATALGAPDLRVRACVVRSGHASLRSRPAEAEDALREALEIAASAGASDADLRRMLGRVLFDLGRVDEACAELERAIAHARADGDEAAESRATAHLGLALRHRGRREEARPLLESALHAHRRLGDRRAAAAVAGNLGILAFDAGRFEEALAVFGEAVREARAIGFRPGETVFTYNVGNALCALGRFEESRAEAQRCLDLAREVENREMEAFALNLLGMLADDDGDAERLLRSAVEVRVSIPSPSGESESRYQLGRRYAESGRAEAAVVELTAACEAARRADVPRLELLTLAALSRLPGGDASAAESALERLGARADVWTIAEVRLALFRATGDLSQLAAAKTLVDECVARNEAHAPSMVGGVNLCREVLEEAALHGL